MTYSDMLYQLYICKFYLYESLLFQVFVSCNLQNLGIPLSAITFSMLLQSTTMLITISVNIFICYTYNLLYLNIFKL